MRAKAMRAQRAKVHEYQFRIALHGEGTSSDEAWEHAVEGFTCEPGGPPEAEIFRVEDCHVLGTDDGMVTFYNDQDRPFRVRLVRRGDRWGREDCLVHKDEPVVEFYDGAHCDDPRFGPRGQFVSSYYASTLMKVEQGLDLVVHEAAWKVDADVVRQVQRWLRHEMKEPRS